MERIFFDLNNVEHQVSLPNGARCISTVLREGNGTAAGEEQERRRRGRPPTPGQRTKEGPRVPRANTAGRR